MEDVITKVIDLIPGKIESITTIDSSDIDYFTFSNEFVHKHKPLLIKNAVKHWPAIEKWKRPNYLESISDDTEVHTSRMFNPAPGDLYFEKVATVKKLSEALKEMTILSELSTYSIPSCGVPSQWLNDLGCYSFLDPKLNKKPRIFPNQRLFIYKNASTEWHYHPTDETLTTQLLGSKKFSLFRPTNENWRFYLRLIRSNFHHMPCSKFFFTDNEAQNLIKYEGSLQAGDALYIPPFWWHGIDPIDATIGITLAHCFRTPLKRFGSFHESGLNLLPACRPLPISAYPYIALSTLCRFLSREKWILE